MMLTVDAGAGVTLTFDLGTVEVPDTPTGASYWVNDEDGATIVAETPVPGWTADASEIQLAIAGSSNALPAGSLVGAREVLVRITNGAQSVQMRQSYRVMQGDALQVPATSFVTLTMAELLSESMVGLSYWASADSDARTNALLAAHARMSGLLVCDVGREGKDYAGYGIHGGGVVRLGGLALSEWQAATLDFRSAIRRAQIAQANHYMDPQSGVQDNVRSIVIGESSRTFFQGAKTPLAAGAMQYISRFLAPPRVGRA